MAEVSLTEEAAAAVEERNHPVEDEVEVEA